MASVPPRVYPGPWYTHSTLGGWLESLSFGIEELARIDALTLRHGAGS